ncbi:MAG: S8 family serine peptidase [Cellulomonadaceae bacterium]
MSSRSQARPARTAAAGLLGLALAFGSVAPAQADPGGGGDLGIGAAGSVPGGGAVVSPLLSQSEGTVTVFVQTVGEGALEVKTRAETRGLSARSADDQVSARVAEIDAVAEDVEQAAQSADAGVSVLYTTQYTVPGVALSVDAAALNELAARDDVVKISPIVPRTVSPQAGQSGGTEPLNANSDALTRALDTWTQTGKTGKGAVIAVIDSGVDYTHAAFGGPGTTEAYQTAVASTDVPDPAWYDADKFLGGWDFAGENYDANPNSTNPNGTPVPQPDPNPIDGLGGGHGTHVAGTAAGYGVTRTGETFDGDYSSLNAGTIKSEFSVGPGSAPEAGVYSLKVFGDVTGSTALTGAAIDWVAQQVADDQQIDILNLSLGSTYGVADDPENAMIDVLTSRGVLSVIAAGNDYDLTDISGSPGNAASALTVAATANGYSFFDAVSVVAPEAVAGTYPGQYSVNYAGSEVEVEGDVVLPTSSDPEGCAPFSAEDAERIAGNFVWIEWDDDVALPCGSAARFNNAEAAGATGVVLSSTVNTFSAGIAGNANIPGVQLTADTTQTVRPALEAGELRMRLTTDQLGALELEDADRVDTPAAFTSRGGHGSYEQIIKPDVAAPGVSILSAANGSGTGGVAYSGTSMATPHTAGIAALVSEAHPRWSAIHVKAQIINTATHDVTTGGVDGTRYAPIRVGTGRVDALAAVTNEVWAQSAENGDLVTASFGVLEVAEPTTLTREVVVRNSGRTARSYDVSYLARNEIPGVSYSVSPATVTVPANGRTSVTVTLSIPDPSALAKTIDPTQEPTQSGLPRQFVADASGVVQLSAHDESASDVRVAVFSAPKPVAAVSGAAPVFEPTSAQGSILLEGRGLDQPGWTSLLTPLQLGVTDPDDDFGSGDAPATLESADILAVGASSTAPQLADPSGGILSFGVVTDGNWPVHSTNTYPVIWIDTDSDGTPDAVSYVQPLSDTVDLPVAITIDLATGATADVHPVNNVLGIDSNTTDSNVVVLPVSLSALGFTPESTETTITYWATTESYYAPSGDYVVDETDTATFDVFAPAVWFGDPDTPGVGDPVFLGEPGGELPVHRSDLATEAQVLLLHHHNATGARSQILDLPQGEALVNTAPPVIEGTPTVGETLSVSQGEWSGADGAEFSYQWLRGGEAIEGALEPTYTLVGADAGTQVSAIVTATLGEQVVTAAAEAVTVAQGASQVSIALSASSQTYGGSPVTVTATVTPSGGEVAFLVGDQTVATAAVEAGVGSVSQVLPADLPAGRHQVTAAFTPSPESGLAPSTSEARTLTVRKASSSTSLRIDPVVSFAGRPATANVTVRAGGAVPSGEVTIRSWGRVVASGTVTDGTASLRLALKPGVHLLYASYEGSDSVNGSTSSLAPVLVLGW